MKKDVIRLAVGAALLAAAAGGAGFYLRGVMDRNSMEASAAFGPASAGGTEAEVRPKPERLPGKEGPEGIFETAGEIEKEKQERRLPEQAGEPEGKTPSAGPAQKREQPGEELKRPEGPAGEPEKGKPAGPAGRPEKDKPEGPAGELKKEKPAGPAEGLEKDKPEGPAGEPEKRKPAGPAKGPEKDKPEGPEKDKLEGPAGEPEKEKPAGPAEGPEKDKPEGPAERRPGPADGPGAKASKPAGDKRLAHPETEKGPAGEI